MNGCIKLEDHCPGRATRVSLLRSRSGSAGGGAGGAGGRGNGTVSRSHSPPILPAAHEAGQERGAGGSGGGLDRPLQQIAPSASLPSLHIGESRGSDSQHVSNFPAHQTLDILSTAMAGSRAGTSTINGMGSTETPSSSFPYRYGDGLEGYQIRFFQGLSDEGLLSEAESSAIAKHIHWAIWLSLIVNVILFVTKTVSAFVSRSLSVAASAVDSALDLLSQVIVWLAERGSKDHDSSLYPAGRSRLEPVGIIICAALMGMASLQLILESVEQLVAGFSRHGERPQGVAFDAPTLLLLGATIVAKLALWIYCQFYAKYSPTLYTLAVDHRNDVLSNSVALVAAIVAWRWESLWSCDPIGAVLMSLFIVWNWIEIGREQIEHIVGRAADPEFVETVRDISSTFHPALQPDIIRAYHFGARYLVELEVVLPAEMTVREAHDISLALQQSIEQLPRVERCFVHVDWRGREGEDEHDAKSIAQKTKHLWQQQITAGQGTGREAQRNVIENHDKSDNDTLHPPS